MNANPDVRSVADDSSTTLRTPFLLTVSASNDEFI
jgi:hypothetical protein